MDRIIIAKIVKKDSIMEIEPYTLCPDSLGVLRVVCGIVIICRVLSL